MVFTPNTELDVPASMNLVAPCDVWLAGNLLAGHLSGGLMFHEVHRFERGIVLALVVTTQHLSKTFYAAFGINPVPSVRRSHRSLRRRDRASASSSSDISFSRCEPRCTQSWWYASSRLRASASVLPPNGDAPTREDGCGTAADVSFRWLGSRRGLVSRLALDGETCTCSRVLNSLIVCPDDRAMRPGLLLAVTIPGVLMRNLDWLLIAPTPIWRGHAQL